MYVLCITVCRPVAHSHQALTAMLEEATTGSNLTRKATLLMAEVLQIANRVLPLSVAAKLQASVPSQCYMPSILIPPR